MRFVVEQRGQVINWNEAAYRLLGYSAEEMIGQTQRRLGRSAVCGSGRFQARQ
ncbi:PAS domain-containing protein [Candidatus Aalborgicola defluviihabitans]|uniref:PAS domain-containing protein n=1 Tax=Candidatus Aalborgicola defluviihabitans TaxID=3386187 RepID=UPI001DD55A4B|nr:PAS domain-containing protein [Burkholderiales bacterium]MBK7280609.1 PAS domain-containing protein [Burkholderiales bacterium]